MLGFGDEGCDKRRERAARAHHKRCLTVAARDVKRGAAVGDVVGFAGDADDARARCGQILGGRKRRVAGIRGVHTLAALTGARQGHDFRGVAADYRGFEFQKAVNHAVAPWDKAGGHGV